MRPASQYSSHRMLYNAHGQIPWCSGPGYPGDYPREREARAGYSAHQAHRRAYLLAVPSRPPHHHTMCVKPEATFFPHTCRCSRAGSPSCSLSRSLTYPASIDGPTPALQDVGRSRSSLLQSVLEENKRISRIQPEPLRPDLERPLREG